MKELNCVTFINLDGANVSIKKYNINNGTHALWCDSTFNLLVNEENAIRMLCDNMSNNELIWIDHMDKSKTDWFARFMVYAAKRWINKNEPDVQICMSRSNTIENKNTSDFKLDPATCNDDIRILKINKLQKIMTRV